MENKIVILDYVILAQLVLSILAYYFIKFNTYSNYKGFIVLLAILIFFSYWIIRVVFNKQYENMISN